MKHILYSILGAMFISVGAAQAQQYDTAGTSTDRQRDDRAYEQRQSTPDNQQDNNAWRSDQQDRQDQQDQQSRESYTTPERTQQNETSEPDRAGYNQDSYNNERRGDVTAPDNTATPGDQQRQQRDASSDRVDDRARNQPDSRVGEENRQSQSYNSEEAGSDALEGMVVVDKDEIPASLRKKLEQDEKYAGWENGTVYHNTNSGEYLIAPRAYRFDSDGNEVGFENAPSYPESREGAAWADESDQDQQDARQDNQRAAEDRTTRESGEQPSRTYRENEQADQQQRNQQQENQYRQDTRDRSGETGVPSRNQSSTDRTQTGQSQDASPYQYQDESARDTQEDKRNEQQQGYPSDTDTRQQQR